MEPYGVVTLAVKAGADEVQRLHLRVGNRDAFRIGGRIGFAADAQAGLGVGGADEIDDEAV